MLQQKPVVIGIAGGSCSGKTSITNAIRNQFTDETIVVIDQDAYYKDQSHLSLQERSKVNYDHPQAFDQDLLLSHIQGLLNGQAIEKPIYNFKSHTRSTEITIVNPKEVIIIEGILILEDSRLRDLMDIKLFVDVDPDIRMIRRLMRDVRERGRTLESVIKQYVNMVRPMHVQFVEPTKRYADMIIPEGGQNDVAIDLLTTKVKSILETNQAFAANVEN
ncbi:MAG TPA: uridine kinase [Bacillota bacterium]|nr:uridine kinase [Bacillota bacterium]